MKKIITLTPILVLLVIAAFAQERTPRINERQAVQHARIAEGRQSGQVTKGEAKLLHAEQRQVRRTERRVKSDGDVTGRERRRLTREQNRANRDIRRAKHNGIQSN